MSERRKEFEAWWDNLLTSKGVSRAHIDEINEGAKKFKQMSQNLDLSFAKKVKIGRKKGESMQKYKKRAYDFIKIETYMLDKLEDSD